MADFVAVLRKTIGGLSDNTPEMREKVYDKARATIEAKIAALNPQPPLAIIERQRKAMEDAIAVLRADYDQPVIVDNFDDIIASLDGSEPFETHGDESELVSEQPSPEPFAAPPVAVAPVTPVAPAAPEPVLEAKRTPPELDPVSVGSDAQAMRDTVANDDRLDLDHERRPAEAKPAAASTPRRKGISAGLIAASLVGLLIVAGALYALWPSGGSEPQVAEQPAPVETQETPATTAEELPETPSPEEEVAAATPEPEPTISPTPPADSEKFTQRLMPDGSEVDEGPAGGARTIGEGTSIAAVASPGEEATPPAAPSATATEPAPAAPASNADEPTIAVGQRAIFYEERTSSSQGSAEAGSIVWSVVQESPGGDLPPEPAIRGEATIPANDVRLRMTIRRNADQTLPAAHIVEMIFLTPEGFGGGVISSVSRMAFKETEQAAGNPLLGIPAKIADGFFLIALSDAPNEIETNLQLLARRSWIDIPIVYQSGRRALLSLEKGIPGERVFQEALEAWRQAASAG